MHDIKIGTIVPAGRALDMIPKLLPLGFECFALDFQKTTGNTDLPELAKKVRAITDPAGAEISCVSIYGNPLTGTGLNADTEASWARIIDNVHLFGTDLVTGFTGRITGEPLPDSMPAFKKVFGELTRRAKDKGARIAFENCPMGGDWRRGDWNIAINPVAWEMMFNEVPADNMGLEWEPCHQMTQLIDPIPQLRKWTGKIFHLHGKDATIAWDVVKEHGTSGACEFVWHRTPGFGDTNWTDVISILRQNGYKGNIDIEGYHDPVYRGELEWTGQVRGLNYLKECRGGDFITL